MSSLFYGAYGLTINAPLPLPELETSAARADVTVRFGHCGLPAPGHEARGFGQALDEDGTRLFWKEAGHFLISQGREIVIDPAPNADEGLIRAALLGPVLAALLHQRGFVVLHASAIDMDGSAVAFMAQSGEGKSTTAAAFHQAGYPVIADDLVAVRFTSGSPEVVIGFPQLKLLPDALVGLGEDPNDLPRIYGDADKRAHRVRMPTVKEPLPLRALYILISADFIRIESLKGAAALKALANFTFASSLLGPAGLRVHFSQCAALAPQGVVRRLSRPRDLKRLSEMLLAVKADDESSS